MHLLFSTKGIQKWADDYYVGILKNKVRTYDVLKVQNFKCCNLS
jgi:hypothetical protein